MTKVEQLYAALPEPMRNVLRIVEQWRAHKDNARDTCAEASLGLLMDAQDELEQWQAKMDAAEEDLGVRATQAHVSRAKKARGPRPKLRLVKVED